MFDDAASHVLTDADIPLAIDPVDQNVEPGAALRDVVGGNVEPVKVSKFHPQQDGTIPVAGE